MTDPCAKFPLRCSGGKLSTAAAAIYNNKEESMKLNITDLFEQTKI